MLTIDNARPEILQPYCYFRIKLQMIYAPNVNLLENLSIENKIISGLQHDEQGCVRLQKICNISQYYTGRM